MKFSRVAENIFFQNATQKNQEKNCGYSRFTVKLFSPRRTQRGEAATKKEKGILESCEDLRKPRKLSRKIIGSEVMGIGTSAHQSHKKRQGVFPCLLS